MASQRKILCLLLLLVAVFSNLVVADGKAEGADDDVSNPSGGADATAIIRQSKQMMHTSADAADGSDDSTDGTTNVDTLSQGGKNTTQTYPGGGDAKNMKSHGTCVTGCATQSTQGVGCGSDLSKPECFCKSQDFIVQAFTCVNTTCPEQYHGAAGVFMSICGVVGGPGIEIPGYKGSSNLEQMPQVIPDSSTNITNSTSGNEPAVAPPAGVVVTPPKSSSTLDYTSPTSTQSLLPNHASAAKPAHIVASIPRVLAALLVSTLVTAGFYVLF